MSDSKRQKTTPTEGMSNAAQETENMLGINNLTYQLEPDLSVAVNKTMKTHFFQQNEYKSSQPAIAILNSGADYIDTRRSFLSFRVNLSCLARNVTATDILILDDQARLPIGGNVPATNLAIINGINDTFIINGLFGANGSILNLIDTVTVTTRSGDELSRITDLALLSNMLLPLHHGSDWKETVGALMGFGDGIYGRSDKVSHPLADRTYSIPLYLLSPLFAYGRLMPAMLMSGLRIQITWHQPAQAFMQIVSRVIGSSTNLSNEPNGLVPGNGNREHVTTMIPATTGKLSDDIARNLVPYYMNVDVPISVFTNQVYAPSVNMPLCPAPGSNWYGTSYDPRVRINGQTGGVHAPGYNWSPDTGADRWYTQVTRTTETSLISNGRWKQFLRNPNPITSYEISSPVFTLCSVQLSDSIQRNLNEWSAVNGLEIVYTDYDLTTSPVENSIGGVAVYTEVRKSASRALAAYARLVPTFINAEVERMADSNQATVMYREDLASGGKGWVEYQWQLGSLYFPQQKVVATLGPAEFDPIAYAHTLEAVDKYHGAGDCWLALDKSYIVSRQVNFASPYTDWALNYSSESATVDSQDRTYVVGRRGTFSGGGHVIAVSLERSSLFNLSGIPINNSRVLALRGRFAGVPTPYTVSNRLNIYLKFVKLARIFLNNTEVEQ